MVAITVGCLFAPAGQAAAADRSEFIAQADPICQATNDAMRKAQRGSVRDFRKGRNRRAGAKVLRGARIFRSGINQIAALSQPVADAALLSQWIEGLRVQADRMAAVGRAVRASRRPSKKLGRAQRAWARQVTANEDLVAGLGFQSCA